MQELKTIVWERIGMLGNEQGLLTLTQGQISLKKTWRQALQANGK
jgi:hypothetical protein